MGLKIIVLTVVLSAVIVVSESERICDKMPEIVREKRSKYYSSAPQRFYRRPPITYPVKGPFSYTPPPFYSNDNADSFPPSRPKVSKKPRNDGLGEEDINNIVKYLSKQDLGKIIEIAYEKDKYIINKEFEYNNPPSNDRHTHKGNVEQYKEIPIEYSNNPNVNFQMYKTVHETTGVNERPRFYPPNKDQKPYEIIYNSPPQENVVPRIVNSNPNSNGIDSINTPFDVQESMQYGQIEFFNKHIVEEDIRNPVYADSKAMNEEILPRPVNLREEDYYGSFTHNVPSVVKADSTSYKVENFGDLPLMNYNSKLDSVSSYHVPHYTITTPNKEPSPLATSYGGSSSSSDVPLEPAPPISEAKAQSDAHLKATRIWTHKSRGTAYYLHSDGTLSLEKPKTKPYGP
ncbi:uncharacterized protein LOC135309763 [Plodia interpunctella]|uniref:uncharacterized protein LOC135309763 n=1 Tax=Plodia interpunctella TaxID=58824 RepID=UPI0031017C32